MRNATVARRYARALYQTAVSAKSVDDVLQAMSNVAHALEASADLKQLFLNPLVRRELKQKLMTIVTSNKLVLKFIDLLAERKRMDLFFTIHEMVASMADESRGVLRALVKTAVPLSDAQKRAIEAGLAQRMGGTIVGHFEIAKDLIGGVWAKMGDKVLDASLKGRIETFRHTLVNSTN